MHGSVCGFVDVFVLLDEFQAVQSIWTIYKKQDGSLLRQHCNACQQKVDKFSIGGPADWTLRRRLPARRPRSRITAPVTVATVGPGPAHALPGGYNLNSIYLSPQKEIQKSCLLRTCCIAQK
jgi:hypothetical protein